MMIATLFTAARSRVGQALLWATLVLIGWEATKRKLQADARRRGRDETLQNIERRTHERITHAREVVDDTRARVDSGELSDVTEDDPNNRSSV